jgi:flagellar biosynthesis chaperone FliJ
LAATVIRADTAEANAKREGEERKKAQAAADKANADLATTQGQLSDAQKSLADAQNTVTTQKATIDDLNKKLIAATSAGTPPPLPPGISADDFKKVQDQLKDSQAAVAELKTVNDTLKNKADDATSQLKTANTELARYHGNIMRNGLEGEVLAVNPGWNFVVLSIGDRQGAVTNAEMILKRGNSEIGKVRITSVEPSTSVADIVPGSLARGVRVQPGDRVIFQGS